MWRTVFLYYFEFNIVNKEKLAYNIAKVLFFDKMVAIPTLTLLFIKELVN